MLAVRPIVVLLSAPPINHAHYLLLVLLPMLILGQTAKYAGIRCTLESSTAVCLESSSCVTRAALPWYQTFHLLFSILWLFQESQGTVYEVRLCHSLVSCPSSCDGPGDTSYCIIHYKNKRVSLTQLMLPVLH